MADLRVIVVDDEPLARERVTSLVRAGAGLVLVGEAKNGLEALDLITGLEPDLALIDIEMPVLSGFGVVAAIEGQRVPGIIFVTAYDQYAVRAFEVGAIDYLLKPVTRPRFAAAIERARLRLASRGQDRKTIVATAAEAERARGLRTRYVVRRGATHHFVPVDEIDWVESADNYLRLHTGDRVHLARGTLTDAAAELDPARFLRIHRSIMVAIDRIKSVRRLDSGGYLVVTTGDRELRVSRTYVEPVRTLLGRRLERGVD